MSEPFTLSPVWNPNSQYTSALKQECQQLLGASLSDPFSTTSSLLGIIRTNPDQSLEIKTYLRAVVCQILQGKSEGFLQTIVFNGVGDVVSYMGGRKDHNIASISPDVTSIFERLTLVEGATLGGADIREIICSLQDQKNQGGKTFGDAVADFLDYEGQCKNLSEVSDQATKYKQRITRVKNEQCNAAKNALAQLQSQTDLESATNFFATYSNFKELHPSQRHEGLTAEFADALNSGDPVRGVFNIAGRRIHGGDYEL